MIDVSEGIDVNISDESQECNKFQPSTISLYGCHDMAQKSMSFNDAAIVTVKKHDNRINLWFIRKAEAVSRMIIQA